MPTFLLPPRSRGCRLLGDGKRWWWCLESEYLKCLCFALFAFYSFISSSCTWYTDSPFLYPRILKNYMDLSPDIDFPKNPKGEGGMHCYEHPLWVSIFCLTSAYQALFSFGLGKMTSHYRKFAFSLWCLAENSFGAESSRSESAVSIGSGSASVHSMWVHSSWFWSSKSAWLSVYGHGVFSLSLSVSSKYCLFKFAQSHQIYNPQFFLLELVFFIY